ncbi:jerky protein homolog-like [Osmia bicornis bicornis]|uniref:jerky protein homolog-like n=1 Tax=Osmia bicornis bicornis TaxID=1437191 RepID=UPI0010F80632|nr:jerky protein homolog-like [Osmia bicornis bicornis]
MQQRLDVLKDLDTTSVSAIAKKYGVNRKTIRRIINNAPRIHMFANKNKREKKRRRIVEPVYNELDERLLTWYIEKRTLGDKITDALMLAKATQIKEDLPSCSSFKASHGWLAKFKARHNIRLVRLYHEESNAEEETAENENQQIKEEGTSPKELQESFKSEEMMEDHNDEATKTELINIFERLTFYSARAPAHIQCIVKGLKIFFLDEEH